MQLIILCCLVAMACAAPASPSFDPADVNIRYDNITDKGFSHQVEQSNGTKSQAEGTLFNADESAAGYQAQPTIKQGSEGSVLPEVVTSLIG